MNDEEIKKLISEVRSEEDRCIAAFFNCVYAGQVENDMLSSHATMFERLCNVLEEKMGWENTSKFQALFEAIKGGLEAVKLKSHHQDGGREFHHD